MAKLQSVVKVYQRGSEPQKKRHMAEDENPISISKNEQGEYKSTNIRKLVEFHPIAIDAG